MVFRFDFNPRVEIKSGRIGKPVRLRHGPATVIGEFFGTALASHCPSRFIGTPGWEGVEELRSKSQETCRASNTASWIERAYVYVKAPVPPSRDGGFLIWH